MKTWQKHNRTIYAALVALLLLFLLLDYIPGMHTLSSWVTPPVALFLGLAFPLTCEQAFPVFNKKASK